MASMVRLPFAVQDLLLIFLEITQRSTPLKKGVS